MKHKNLRNQNLKYDKLKKTTTANCDPNWYNKSTIQPEQEKYYIFFLKNRKKNRFFNSPMRIRQTSA